MARRRNAVLRLGERLGNISEACRRAGIDRKTYYLWKRIRDQWGEDGLARLPARGGAARPAADPAANVLRIRELVLSRPDWDSTKVMAALREEGFMVSEPLVHQVLTREGLASPCERIRKLEQSYLSGSLRPSPELLRALECANPCLRERHCAPSRPAQVLVQDSLPFPIGTGTKLRVEVVVDAYCCYGFASLCGTDDVDGPMALLESDVFGFYRNKGLWIDRIVTRPGAGYGDDERPEYGKLLQAYEIRHEERGSAEVKNGCIEYFEKALKAELLATAAEGDMQHETLANWSRPLRRYMRRFNSSRRVLGYPNLGRSPAMLMADW